MSLNPKMLFVCGTPRSGTTAMHALLTVDERIILGLERFGAYCNEEFGPKLFTKERFFDFVTDPRDKNSLRPYYSEIAEPNFDSAVYIGDKIPLMYLEFDRVVKVFPEARFIVLLRNIVDICNSYQNRKDDPGDDWSLSVDDAVRHWNQLLHFLKTRSTDPRIKVVIYEEFYSNMKVSKDIYDFLGLDFDDALKSKYKNILDKTAVLEQRRKSSLSDTQKLSIYKGANFSLYQSILNSNSSGLNMILADARTSTNTSTTADSKGRNPMALGSSDLLSVYRILLGRTELSTADANELAGLNGQQVLSKIFRSPEFQGNAFNRDLVTSLARQIREQLTPAPLPVK
jgi:hypothetical protein